MNNSIPIFGPVFSILWHAFEIFAEITDRFLQIFGVLILVGMWGLLCVNAIARWTDVLPIGWSLEITSYMVAWSIFITMGPITRADEQIKVTFLPEKLLGSERGALFIHAAENIIGLIICTYVSYYAYVLIDQTRDLHYEIESSGGWYYPMWILRSGILIGFGITAYYYLERTIKMIKRLLSDSQSAGQSGQKHLLSSMLAAEDDTDNGNGQESQTVTSNVTKDDDIYSGEKE